MLFAEVKDLLQIWIVASFEFFYEAYPSCLHSDFYSSIVAEDLVETKLFPSIFRKDVPVLDNIYQFCCTLSYCEA